MDNKHSHDYLVSFPMLQQGCVEIVESSMGAKVTETEERMCGSIYNEAVSEVKDGRVQQMKQDLFMEQRQ